MIPVGRAMTPRGKVYNFQETEGSTSDKLNQKVIVKEKSHWRKYRAYVPSVYSANNK